MEETRQGKGCGHDHRTEVEGGLPGLEESRPMSRTLSAFMPKSTEVKNSFMIFQVEEVDYDDDDEGGGIGGIDDGEGEG